MEVNALSREDVLAATPSVPDHVVYRAFVRMMNMIETPEQAFSQPRVLLHALRVWLRGKRRNAVYALPPPPDRAAVMAACAALPGSA